MIARVFQLIGCGTRYFVEIGAGTGRQCNTRWLRENGWRGVMMDRDHANPRWRLFQEVVTAENINCIFARYRVPASFDLLSIDIDGNDYWVWRALSARYRPRVVVVEFNAAVPAHISVTMPYQPSFRWRGEANIGQSLLAAKQLGSRKGYALAHAEPPNAYFVAREHLPLRLRELSVTEALGMETAELHPGQLDRWRTQLQMLKWSYV